MVMENISATRAVAQRSDAELSEARVELSEARARIAQLERLLLEKAAAAATPVASRCSTPRATPRAACEPGSPVARVRLPFAPVQERDEELTLPKRNPAPGPAPKSADRRTWRRRRSRRRRRRTRSRAFSSTS